MTPPDPGATAGRRPPWVPIGLVLGALVLAVVALQVATRPACTCAHLTPTTPPSPVEGVVLTIDSGGLADVRGFTLRTASGQVLTFTLGTLDNATEFAPGHLGEHQATAEPIRVSFRVVDSALVVYRLEDASVAAPS